MARNRTKSFLPIARGDNRLSVHNEGAPEIVLIGTVGKNWFSDEGITEKEFRDALKTVPRGTNVTVKVNSEGGSVKEGLGIYNAIKERRDDITVRVTGYALSIASVFPLAASKVISPKSSIWMMHKAWSFTEGNADDMEQSAEMLKQHDETLAEIYAAETGKPIQEMRDAMAAETWLRGSEAVDFGLADEGDETDDANASFRPLSAEFIGRCKNLSGAVLNMVAPNQKPISGSLTPPASKPNNTDSIMNRKQVEALLKKHAIEFPADATDEQLAALLETIPANQKPPTPPAPPAPPANTGETVTAAEFRAEKRKRIHAEVIRRGENKIANASIETWVNRAMADETSVLSEIDGMPVAFDAGQPIRAAGRVEIVTDGGLDKIRAAHKTASARYGAMRADWNELFVDACKRDARSGAINGSQHDLFRNLALAGINPFSHSRVQLPLNANTITSVLTNFLIDGSVTDLQNRWAMLRAFSLDFNTDGYKPLAPGILKHVTAGSTAQTNPTSYESGNSTVAPVTVTPAEHSVSYQISNTDLNSGVRMADLVTVNTANFANIVIEAALAPVTTANFTGGSVVSAAAVFGFSDLAQIQALLKKSPIKNLILDGAYIARIANTPGFFQTAGVVGGSPQAWKAFGWDGIYQNTDWTGAGANAVGFACHPQAIGGIIGLPMLPAIIPGNILASNVVTVEGLDIQILAEAWFNPATRTSWNSLRVMDGWSKVDATAGFLITSA
jgi:ATP-dependent protease ClpP protease subunit